MPDFLSQAQQAPAALMKLAKTPGRGAETPVLLATTDALFNAASVL